ncbi:unnamed protein product [Microthlaspi erraticum]|uniref:Uncharacterized protein n=1 Tax=Microthlaspi erraticum TaxID=1685480 RepID=A0A6D2HBC6_9BRAS|nr:unnamed protein product [Microthlaspi erraticum]
MEQMNPLLDLDSKDEVRMIGIWGMGGIGKTTIAKYIYEQLRHQFSPHNCFIQNVRETSTKHGLLHLQELLLSKILGKVDEKLWSVEQGADLIKSRLGKRKILIVLDDVDDVKQALAQECAWFGPGSRIIVTTRDKSVFNFCYVVYDVKCLDKDDALNLFVHIAFKGRRPLFADIQLSLRAYELGHGLPLALEALGLYLHGKFQKAWEIALASFKAAPYENITNILKVSYNSLNKDGKTAFLHVACLFNGDPVWRAMTLLDSGELGISLLEEKSLINISNDGYIAMHALVENMGRQIVKLESGNKPSDQRILWDPEDIYSVLVENARLLHLRRLDMTGSKDLKELPNLQEAVCLEELILRGCISLKRIPTSIFRLSKLKKFDLFNCDGIKNLIIIGESEPTAIQVNSSGRCMHVRLIRMDFQQKKEMESVPLTNLSVMGNIKIELELLWGDADHLCFISEQKTSDKQMMSETCAAQLSSPPYSFKSLDIMRLTRNKKRDPFECYSFTDFPWLTDLNLINLNIKKIPDDINHMQVLEKLDLSGNDFRVLPTSMIHLPRLKHVTLSNCRRLEALPELYQLETLTLSDCNSLRVLVNLLHSEQDQRRYCLLELRLDNCKNVQSLSDQLTRFTNLTYLDISRHDFETVPTSIKDLSSLVTLCLNYCKKLKSLKESLPLSLKYLYAHGCECLDTSIDHDVDHLDLSPCIQWKQDSSQIIRFPAGRRSEEVHACECFQETKMPIMNQAVTRSPISVLIQRLKPILRGLYNSIP